MVGNEDDEYLNNEKNGAVVSIKEVVEELDHDIWKFIDCPVGSEFIRISPNEFEKDKKIKKYISKRENYKKIL